MTGLLALLGFGVFITVLVGSGGDDASDDAAVETEEFSDQEDAVLAESYRGAVQANIADLIAEGELSQEQGDAAIAAVNFRTGALDVDTGAGDDIVAGGAGDDMIATGAGEDAAFGGPGDDRIELGADDDFSGVDTRSIVTPDDIISFTQADSGIFGAGFVLEAGDDTVLGGAGADAISDSFGRNVVNGQQGNDFIVTVDEETGARTPDVVSGGFGNDTLIVDEGDIVTVGPGRDLVTVDVFGGVGDGFAGVTITDFVPGLDLLELEGSFDLLQPGALAANPVSVADLADGSGALVSVNGIGVVRVLGGAGLTAVDIRIST